ncbi:uncharacterized protein Tco025E_04281 [Trypanosoma conorhini]|uniref:Uncharacterized protein n=1 Tax=Trypanosoma conorhini TaxID=83891 RepID=A0A3R7MQM7_9TRYP|nr:uncharacterized protein Tco025E_04281 [Trypanosoma conorhini]RNF19091.1 hypothetical protein Tco025E_04281 [Trypanosoma conorhini]
MAIELPPLWLLSGVKRRVLCASVFPFPRSCTNAETVGGSSFAAVDESAAIAAAVSPPCAGTLVTNGDRGCGCGCGCGCGVCRCDIPSCKEEEEEKEGGAANGAEREKRCLPCRPLGRRQVDVLGAQKVLASGVFDGPCCSFIRRRGEVARKQVDKRRRGERRNTAQ